MCKLLQDNCDRMVLPNDEMNLGNNEEWSAIMRNGARPERMLARSEKHFSRQFFSTKSPCTMLGQRAGPSAPPKVNDHTTKQSFCFRAISQLTKLQDVSNRFFFTNNHGDMKQPQAKRDQFVS